MTKAIIGTWGKSLAVRVPADVVRLAGLSDGEVVDIESIDGNILMRRDEAEAAKRQDAFAAAQAIIAARKGVRLNGLAIRDLIGTRLVELYYTQLHRLHRVHADHHPGNYLFHLDGRIGMIDFGCVKKLNFDASDLIRSCINRTWREGEKAAARVLAIICGPQVPYRRARTMLPTLETMAGILYPDGKGGNSVVDFGKGQLQQMLTAALKQALRDKVTNPEFAFISRADLGLYSLLSQLNARVNVRETWQRCDR